MSQEVKMHILIVNLNNLGFTISLIGDLLRQTFPFKLTLIDNASDEPGTKGFLEDMRSKFDYKIIEFDERIDLNRLWNGHYLSTDCKYLCFLNNDIRVPSNFVEDTVRIFEKEPSVGCVVHVTNNPDFRMVTDLKYEIHTGRIVQGWDFSLRYKTYSMIPGDLKVFGGDDYLFNHLYNEGWKVAEVFSSPIVHYYARSRKFFKGNRDEECENVKKYFPFKTRYGSKHSNRWPKFNEIIERNEI